MICYLDHYARNYADGSEYRPRHNVYRRGNPWSSMKNKPEKPYPGFPLYAHAVGQWAKKINGSTYYFGVWADPDAALRAYQRDRDDLHARGPRMFSASELRAIVNRSPLPLRAFVLLGINCGFGQTDCAEVSPDLVGDWLDFPRPKTAIVRRCPIWTETRDAVEAAGESFRHTPRGLPWVRYHQDPTGKVVKVDAIGVTFGRLVKSLGIAGRGFYALRHTFATIAGECRDDPAVDMIMGHADASIRARYREGIGDDRLQRVADHVYQWFKGIE